MRFNRKRLHARLRKLRQQPRRTRHKFIIFATRQGCVVRYYHLRRFILIIRKLNRLLIDALDMAADAKWLRRHHYGRFNAVTPEFNLPVLTDSHSTIAVKLVYNHSARLYLQFIAGKMELPFVEHRLAL